jgi:endo-1,4-beta-xylanase
MGLRRFFRPAAVLAALVAAGACAADRGDDPKTDAAAHEPSDAASGGSSGSTASSGASSSGSDAADDAPTAVDAMIVSGEAGGDGMAASADVSAPPSCPSCPLQVDYYTLDGVDAGIGSIQTISFYINIANAGPEAQALSELTVRYWFTAEGDSTLTMECYYAATIAMPQNNIPWTFKTLTATTTPKATPSADTYLEMSFTTGAGSIAPMSDTGVIQLAVHDTTYGPIRFNEANDYSYNPGDTAANCSTNNAPSCATSMITLYRNGVLVWGTEPPGGMTAAGDP